MANESRVFRLPAGNEYPGGGKTRWRRSFHPLRGWRYRVPKPQKAMWCRAVRKRRLEDIAGMRMATTVQMIRMDDNLKRHRGSGRMVG